MLLGVNPLKVPASADAPASPVSSLSHYADPVTRLPALQPRPPEISRSLTLQPLNQGFVLDSHFGCDAQSLDRDVENGAAPHL